MIRLLNKARKSNRLYVRLLRQEAGAVINGEALSSLPPSVLAVMEADRNGGSFSPLRNADGRRMGAGRRRRRFRVAHPDDHHRRATSMRHLHPLEPHWRRPSRRSPSPCSRPRRRRFWQVATRADFLKGDVENLSVDNDGRLSLGPPTALVYDSAAPFLWTVVEGARRLGLSEPATRARSSAWTRTARARRSTTRPNSRSTRWRRRRTAASTSPRRPTARSTGSMPTERRSRSSSQRRSTSGRWPWTRRAGLRRHGREGRHLPDRRRTARARSFYKTRATNVVALAFDTAGNLLAGTESPGRVFRIDREGKAFVLLESAFREIHSLRVDDDGVIYAVAVAAKGGGAATSARPDTAAAEAVRTAASASVSAEITGVRGDRRRRARGRRREAGGGQDRPARLAGRGLPHPARRPVGHVWESADDTPYDVAFDAGGGVLVGHGHQGKIFRVAGDPPQVDAGRPRPRPAGHALPARGRAARRSS